MREHNTELRYAGFLFRHGTNGELVLVSLLASSSAHRLETKVKKVVRKIVSDMLGSVVNVKIIVEVH